MGVLEKIKLEWADREMMKDIAFQQAAGKCLTREQEEAYKAGYRNALARICAEIRLIEITGGR